MRQVVIPRHGTPDVLDLREGPDPVPGVGEVRIRVRAAGINFADILARLGLYPDAPKPPCVVGYEVGGMDYFTKPFDPDILRRKIAVYASFRMRADLLRERERRVRESEELLRVGRRLSAVLEALPVGVMIADAEGLICQTTDEVARILKAAAPIQTGDYGEIVGWWDRGGRLIKESGPLARAIQKGHTSHSERIAIRCLDGTEKTILASASPLRHLDGRIAGAVVLIQDITETARISEDLQERVARLVGASVELAESAGRI